MTTAREYRKANSPVLPSWLPRDAARWLHCFSPKETNLLPNRHSKGGSCAGRAMCEKCVELDKKIEHYRQLSRWITDQQTIEQFGLFVEKLRAEKTALHPEAK
jgi:hypothetical protein